MTHEDETRNLLGDPVNEPDFNDDYEDGGASGCYICGGSGYIVTCIDDLCRGAGECMHGDGESPCPNGCEYNL